MDTPMNKATEHRPLTDATPIKAVPTLPDAQTVTHVQHWTDRLFSFRVTRPASLRFRSGEFVMIGLPNAEKPVFRAYSIASPSWDEELEFFSIKVPGGPLTEHLLGGQPALLGESSVDPEPHEVLGAALIVEEDPDCAMSALVPDLIPPAGAPTPDPDVLPDESVQKIVVDADRNRYLVGFAYRDHSYGADPNGPYVDHPRNYDIRVMTVAVATAGSQSTSML